ncbi:hypothetical protein NK6_4910 [Bradyrhizobium diazoefficiens]|uniref:Uncharacterized protein n=1 Tax=Bradyrhizobium diazoefficiens TaxID=1355477 RepID=A0A0E3VUV5_9BRAD|nr:hypothetical protein NK6_4910 [Bradyrhizobium diazoefficiens]
MPAAMLTASKMARVVFARPPPPIVAPIDRRM